MTDPDTRAFPISLRERESEALAMIVEQPGLTLRELRDALGVGDARLTKIVDRLHGRVRFERTPLPEPVDLEPTMSGRSLSPDVLAARARAAHENDRVAEIAQPRIERHLAAYAMAVDLIEATHQHYADTRDFALTGETRWTATWQIAGRSIGYARALLVLAREGIGEEALPLARSLHECNRLLEVVSNRFERELVIRWLADEDERYVRPRDTRNAVERGERTTNEMILAAGMEPVPMTRDLSSEMYRRMSSATHNRRGAIQPSISEPTREMSRGHHPNVWRRIEAVVYIGTLVEETVSEVGLSLSMWLAPEQRPGWIAGTLKSTLAAFDAVHRSMPLDPDSIRTAARGRQDSFG